MHESESLETNKDGTLIKSVNLNMYIMDEGIDGDGEHAPFLMLFLTNFRRESTKRTRLTKMLL